MLPAEQGGESRLVQPHRLAHADMMLPRSDNRLLPQKCGVPPALPGRRGRGMTESLRYTEVPQTFSHGEETERDATGQPREGGRAYWGGAGTPFPGQALRPRAPPPAGWADRCRKGTRSGTPRSGSARRWPGGC